jgi:chromosomal replication initiation ATPase DnaA
VSTHVPDERPAPPIPLTPPARRVRLLADELRAQLTRMELLPLVEAIARRHGLQLGDLCSGRRTMRHSRAKHEAWHFLRCARDDLSYPNIAKMFGCDHSSVRYGVYAHERRVGAVPAAERDD